MPEVVLRVEMMCAGCVGAVKRILGKMDGVSSFDVNLEERKVTIQGDVTPEQCIEKVAKCGKDTSLWQ